MALEINITVPGQSRVETEFGSVARGATEVSFRAIARVLTVSGDKSAVVASVEFRGDDIRFVRQFAFVPSVADGSPNFIRQSYLHLKSLPDFAGATDC